MKFSRAIATLVAAAACAAGALDWENVHIGGGGGFVAGIVFHPTEKGLAYARTDRGGLYRLNGTDDSWTPVTDSIAHHETWHNWGIDAVAIDPTDPDKVYAAVGLYTNFWDASNGSIITSSDRGSSWSFATLPFKVGGNMPGRGTGERLAVDPANPSVVYFGARSGHGLWRSTDGAKTFSRVDAFTAVGTYVADPTDDTGYLSDIQGLTFITFDSTSKAKDGKTSRIFVGSAVDSGTESVYVSTDAGATWTPVDGQPTGYIPHKCKLQPDEGALYLSYSDGVGPYDGAAGAVFRYDIAKAEWTDISPVNGTDLTYGFGGLAVDLKNPGTIMVASLNSWWPDAQLFRSNDSGQTWVPIWEWAWPERVLHYEMSSPGAPWVYADFVEGNPKQLGSMIEALEIDPLDSAHWLYATGMTVYGGHDLTNWGVDGKNVTIRTLADGIEEFAVAALASAANGTELLVATSDTSGFTFRDVGNITTSPEHAWDEPLFTSSTGVDYAGNIPGLVARVGIAADTTTAQLALSVDGGASWTPSNASAGSGASGGTVAVSADGDTLVWSTASIGVCMTTIDTTTSPNSGTIMAVDTLPQNALIAADKRANGVFYAAADMTFYASTDGGYTFAPTGSLSSIATITGLNGTTTDTATNFTTMLQPTSVRAIAPHPAVAGTAYLSTDIGLLLTTDSGASFSLFSPTSALNNTYAVTLGRSDDAEDGWAVYAFGTGSAGIRLYASSDGGQSWEDVQGQSQGFGAVDMANVVGSGNVDGGVYVGTSGRGVFFAKGGKGKRRV